ncbi:HAD-IB family hydrolase [Clostridium tagluense]|uniref:HAD-IB family hydrolase n=1 Tax=Clostridium tagluense TaxID=360422 RepID=UPI001C6EB774|nr:HAD-IB family hydrolase [Clostridium tagluense]MBW9156666.1 HAD-IB family hydrolase [Clostridium tagluense]WLC64831.1 HAD-IB family hydrolase [Clostridium tagluense]
MEKRIAAFFDIDGTLYREGLITEVFKKLIKSELIENDKWYKEVKPFYVKWDKRIGNYDNYLLKMADIYSEAIIGLHRTQIEFIASQIIKQKGDRVYTYTRDRIKWHKDQGHLIITISGSPIELVREMSIKYGFDDYIGTKYLLNENDVYTGKIIPMWDSASKQTAIETFVGKYNIDLQQSYAYGDTSGDYTMLKSISNPTAINPTKELLLMILNDDELKEKINIMIERKDVVYKLHPEHIDI